MGGFADQLKAFSEKAKAQADDVVKRVVEKVAAELDERSPVGDGAYWVSPPPAGYVGGHFRANWQLGIGSRPTGEIAGVDPTGSETLGRITAAIPEQATGKVYYLVNNTPYSRLIEDGWSKQAPQGIVGLTRIAFPEIVKQAVEESK
ncbi:HK97 gp10 family phage protein [Sphingobium bisphenolivorans]|uniref:HK97 gp10 family phage protein n=1 Tax=Sphingobium bisphenolivorans TaxID=1335760 RepID=UPI00039B4EE8|nr:HK97 gp10 family phage protein [Sphingobium bisphenolivorans]